MDAAAAAAVPTRPKGVNALPNELLVKIFLDLPSPSSFSRTCKAWRAVSTDPARVARYWLGHETLNAFVAALSTKTVRPAVFTSLITLGAVFSRNLYSLLSRAYLWTDSTRAIEPWLPRDWGRRAVVCVSAATMRAFQGKASEISWSADTYSFHALDHVLGRCRSVSADRTANHMQQVVEVTPEDHIALDVLLDDFHDALNRCASSPLFWRCD